jgi:long-chain acyl-CoA synthetase
MQAEPPFSFPDGIATLADLFRWRVRQSPAGSAYRQFNTASGAWEGFSWSDMADSVGRWRMSLQGLNLPHGSRVAILLPNGTAAVGVDLGSLTAGLVPVPLHAIDNPDSIAYILNDSEASVLVLRTRKEWEPIAASGEALPHLQLVVMLDEARDSGGEAGSAPKLVSMRSWLSAAQDDGQAPAVSAEDLAAIVYTSGTTGRPKGVMLTHRNVVANVRSALARVPATSEDVFLSFLPLSHTFERTAGYYLPIAAGSSVAYVRSVAQIAADLKIVRPTVLVSVPRIYERFFAKLQETMAGAGAVTRRLFELAVAVGWRRFSRTQAIGVEGGAAWSDEMLWPLLDMLVARKIRALFGGRLRIAVSGGAPLSSAVAHCFLGLGVPLVQGYGMTETSPVVAVNTLEDNWPDTVGHALPGVEVRIGENSELQVRGDSVMRGYWKRPQDTANIMTADGWLRTGDQASIDHGRVRIVGRIKEIIVTSTGEKIAPGDLELAITADPLFDQALVIGEGRPFLAVLAVLNPEQWKTLAAGQGIAESEAGLNGEAARKALLQRIEAATRSFPHYAVPRAVWSTLEPWTIQNSLMTPTLKLKRNNLLSRYQAEIDSLYQGRAGGR